MNVFGFQEKRLGEIATRTVWVSFRRNRYAKNAVHGERRGKKVERYIAELLSKLPSRNCKGSSSAAGTEWGDIQNGDTDANLLIRVTLSLNVRKGSI